MPASPRSVPADPSAPERSLFPYLFGALFLLTFLGSYRIVEVRPLLLFEAEGRRNIWRFLAGTFPPDLSAQFLGLLVRPFLETIWISVLGTLIAIAIGFPLGLLATNSLMFAGPLHEVDLRGAPGRRLSLVAPYVVARGILSVFRSIPELVWAFMFVRVYGLGAAAGIMALGVSYGGMLGKVYSEILEGANARPIEALQAAGANRLQMVLYGYLPQAFPQIVSYSLYRWECAIRASTIMGFVGAGGLGQEIEVSMRMFNFHQVLTLVAILFLLVAGVDVLSAKIRRRIR